MTARIYTTLTLLGMVLCLTAQPDFTANNLVQVYDGYFRPSVNLGSYISFSEEQLADFSAGNEDLGIRGIGAKSLRPGLFEEFVEQAGYDSKVPEYQYFEYLGMEEHTLIVGFPSAAHRDPVEYCEGKRSELFANLYEPIWDDGENGTPVNDDNYYALYLWKLANTYGDYVRFWEIWNEPGFDFTGGLGWLPPGTEGNWWENNPDPCDYKLRAPVFHYVRLLRISWEVLKTANPDNYIVVSGTGFPAFLDAILRNTDNPLDGSPTTDYPLGGGAYFDVMGYHAYPHFDGTLQEWSNDLNDFIYTRHSDGAAEGLLITKDTLGGVLKKHGYDGTTFPEKLWMITECNVPRKQFEDYLGSEAAQRNFITKAVVTCMANDLLQLHVFKLGDDTEYDAAQFEFDLMGMYKKLDYNNLYFQNPNPAGIAYKTASDFLFEKNYDAARTNALNLPETVGGGAFRDTYGNFTYVLWAKTLQDMSESATATYSFPTNLEIEHLVKRTWDFSYSPQATTISPENIELSATPIFLTDRIFNMNIAGGCTPLQLQLTANNIPNAAHWLWTIEGGTPVTSTLPNPQLTLFLAGNYTATLQIFDANGDMLAMQTDQIVVKSKPTATFTLEKSGPIVRFTNTSQLNADAFEWDFGDGNSSNMANPTHVYAESGNYEVTLTATNECGSISMNELLEVKVPTTTMIEQTANNQIPVFEGIFRPATEIRNYDGWTQDQLADIIAGNPLHFQPGMGVKSVRTSAGEALLNGFGYDYKVPVYQHYENLGLQDNAFLLAFPSPENRDANLYCPDFQSAIFKDLYLDIWDNGENGTPINEANPYASYIYNVVINYRDYVQFWEVFNGPDFDFTGEWGWLPPGEPGNWWENNPDPCNYSLRAPIFYYVRMLRIAYEIIKTHDPEGYVTVSGIAFPSFLDAVLRNSDNPADGSTSENYPKRGGAYFDAISFKSYPHVDGSTIFFDIDQGVFQFERHSDAAADGILRVKNRFVEVLENYGYDGQTYPQKEWMIGEANLPRQAFGDFMGSELAQRNWLIKAWIACIKNDIRRLSIHDLAELKSEDTAVDGFQLMGLFETLTGVTPYNQQHNDEAVALKTTSELLFGTTYDAQQTQALALPNGIRGAAFQNSTGNYIYVLWAKTETDQTEFASASYSFPTSFALDEVYKKEWFYSVAPQSASLISTQNIPLTGTPIFLTELQEDVAMPVAHFQANLTEGCPNLTVQFTDKSLENPETWNWSFPGGVPAVSSEPNPTVTYPNSGIYPVTLEVANAAGIHSSTKQNFIQIQALPEANFDIEINGATVTLTNLSAHGETYFWTFGDGSSSPGLNHSHTYFSNGNYTITLVTTNDCGSATTSQAISIEAAPTAKFNYNQSANCDTLEVVFIDQSLASPTNWEWTFEGGIPATSTLQFPKVSYSQSGFYDISMKTTNTFGSAEITQTIYIDGSGSIFQTVEVCQGDVFNGVIVENDTTFLESFATYLLQCDSTVLTEVKVVETLESTQLIELCAGEIFNGIAWENDTVLIEMHPSSNGCDSLSIIDIKVFESFENNVFVEICAGDSYDNIIIENDTIWLEILISNEGCDSMVWTEITVLTVFEDTLQFEVCQGDLYEGFLIENDTTFVGYWQTTEGCDSTVIAEITALESVETFLIDSIELGESYVLGDSIFMEPGNYEVFFTTLKGCDSLVHLSLTVLDEVGVEKSILEKNLNLSAYPNPFLQKVHIEFTLQKAANTTLSIFDVNGKLIDNLLNGNILQEGNHSIEWKKTNLPSGVYFGKMVIDEAFFVVRLVRL